MSSKCDILVIGAGPGGYVAAIRASQLGFKTMIVEREALGGICLNWGCIPTKALLKSAEVYESIKHGKDFGLEVAGETKVNLEAIVNRSRGVSKQLSAGIGMLMKKNKIEVVMGSGKLINNTTVEVTKADNTKDTIEAKYIILATGARARVLKGFEPSENIWTYREALLPKRMPKKLIVMGSGAIGIEFAYFYLSLGAEVSVIEMQPQIIPTEDREVSMVAQKSFEKKGMKFYISTTVKEVQKTPSGVKVVIEKDGKEEILEGDTLISAVGVVPNLENIGLENTKVELENNRVKVDKYLKTTVPNIFAIGDIVKGPWLAHKASHDAIICVEAIAGLNPHALDPRSVPGCIYTHPQIASIGYKEDEARKLGFDIRVGKCPFIANGQAIALGDTEGFIKTIFDNKTGELLGAHMIGNKVTEMVQGFSIAMNLESTDKELINNVFAHPTLSEVMHESVLDSLKRSINY